MLNSSVPFALGSDGSVYVNALDFDRVTTPHEALERALLEPGPVFIGVRLSAADLKLVTPRLASACREASAFVLGRRQKLSRKK